MENNNEKITSPKEYIDAVKQNKLDVKEMDAYFDKFAAAGKLAELGVEYVDLLKDLSKIHDESEKQLLQQADAITKILLTNQDISQDVRSDLRMMFHVIHKELHDIRNKKTSIIKKIINAATLVILAIVGIIVLILSGGSKDSTKK